MTINRTIAILSCVLGLAILANSTHVEAGERKASFSKEHIKVNGVDVSFEVKYTPPTTYVVEIDGDGGRKLWRDTNDLTVTFENRSEAPTPEEIQEMFHREHHGKVTDKYPELAKALEAFTGKTIDGSESSYAGAGKNLRDKYELYTTEQLLVGQSNDAAVAISGIEELNKDKINQRKAIVSEQAKLQSRYDRICKNERIAALITTNCQRIKDEIAEYQAKLDKLGADDPELAGLRAAKADYDDAAKTIGEEKDNASKQQVAVGKAADAAVDTKNVVCCGNGADDAKLEKLEPGYCEGAGGLSEASLAFAGEGIDGGMSLNIGSVCKNIRRDTKLCFNSQTNCAYMDKGFTMLFQGEVVCTQQNCLNVTDCVKQKQEIWEVQEGKGKGVQERIRNSGFSTGDVKSTTGK